MGGHEVHQTRTTWLGNLASTSAPAGELVEIQGASFWIWGRRGRYCLDRLASPDTRDLAGHCHEGIR